MHWVIEASYTGGYKIRVRFEDGQERIVDLSSHLDGPEFEPLKDLSFFQRFSVKRDIDTIVWPNDADFSLDFLYEIGVAVGEPP
jgi:hypothetical protein